MKQIISCIKNILLPPICCSCNTHILLQHSLCKSCWSDIDFISEGVCIMCGGQSKSYLQPYCSNYCMFAFSKLNTQNKFITAKAITLYSGIIKNLIFKLKYSDNLNIAPFFSKLLNQLYIKQELHADLIVPIPMHIKSIIQKQYNHTEILASHFARYIKIPYSTKSIIKIRATEKQGLLSRAKRLTNLSGAFKIYDASLIKNKNLILLDDVITTSSTMRECVKVLLKSGAKSIHVLAIAKTI